MPNVELKIGVLGCANIAIRSFIPAIIESKYFNLYGIASRSGDKASEYSNKFDCVAFDSYENLLKQKIDCIYIPLPNSLHKEWILKAIKAGIHVICEKSLVETYADAQEIISLARDKNILIMESFMFCYHDQHKMIQELINDKEIGEVRCFKSSFGFPEFSDLENIRYKSNLGGGALLDAGAYTVRATQLFLGNNLKILGSKIVNDKRFNVDFYGYALLENENNVAAQLSWGFNNFYQCKYEIWGSEGKITAQRAFTPGPDMSPLIILEKQGSIKELFGPKQNHFVNILSEFAHSINQGNFEKHYNDILHQSRLLEEIQKTSK